MREEAYQQYLTGIKLFQDNQTALAFKHLQTAVTMMNLLPDKSEDDIVYFIFYLEVLTLAYFHIHLYASGKLYFEMAMKQLYTLRGNYLNHKLYIETVNLAEEITLHLALISVHQSDDRLNTTEAFLNSERVKEKALPYPIHMFFAPGSKIRAFDASSNEVVQDVQNAGYYIEFGLL